jgi:hypothetical protein
MTPDQEQQVLQALYDRLYDAITYAPSGSGAGFDKATTFLQFSKNEAINPDDFKNAASTTNPGGNLATAEGFARMVDSVPAVQAVYAPTQNPLSTVYKTIVDGANTLSTVTPAQEKIYKQAYGFLNKETEITDFTGAKTTQYGPSQIYQTYVQNQTAYITAIVGYRNAFNNYDLTDPKQQREWQANEPLLKNAVSQTYNSWRAQGATQVEQALAAQASSINNAIATAIKDAQDAVSDKNQLASNVGAGPWFMTLAYPTNWTDPAAAANFTQLTLSSKNLKTSSDSSFNSWGGNSSWAGGLWSASASGSSKTENSHMDAQNLTLSARIGVVRILRPWLHEFLFRMSGWSMKGKDQNGISNGALKGNENGLLPLLPTAFVVARDITITADFSSEDKTHAESEWKAGGSVGWGPFSVSGNYAHSEKHDTFQSTFSGGTLTVPGIQIIGWISEIVPASPPMGEPAGV